MPDQHSFDDIDASELKQPEVTLDQIRSILEMLRRTIEGASHLAGRLETVQEQQRNLIDTFEKRANLQNRLNQDLAQTVAELARRVEYLEGRGPVVN